MVVFVLGEIKELRIIKSSLIVEHDGLHGNMLKTPFWWFGIAGNK